MKITNRLEKYVSLSQSDSMWKIFLARGARGMKLNMMLFSVIIQNERMGTVDNPVIHEIVARIHRG